MKFLVALCAVVAVACGEPAAVGYAFSAPAIHGYPWAHAAAPAYSPLAYSAAPAYSPLAYSAAPAYSPFAYSAAPAYSPLAYSAPVVAAPIKSQYHSQDELGQASYGHAEPTQSHNAIQDAAGNKVGSFSFVNPDGKLVRTDYVADSLGYRVASNDLPAAPAVLPAAPEDTPEVAAAKAAHLAEVAKASSQSRKKRAIAYPYSAYPYAAYPYAAYPYSAVYPHAYPTTHTVPVVTADGYLADTPEVSAAKAAHFAEHAAAHARGKRSAAAPVPVITPASTTPYIAAPYSPIAYSAYPYSAVPYSAYSHSAYPYSAYPYSAYPYSAFYKK